MNRRTQTIALPLLWAVSGVILSFGLAWLVLGAIAGLYLTWLLQRPTPQERHLDTLMEDNRRDYFLHPLLTYYRRNSSPSSVSMTGTVTSHNGLSSASRGDERTR